MDVSVDLQGIEPFLSQYPESLNDLALELRFIHPWDTNPKTGKNRTIPIFRRIVDIKADPKAINALIDRKLEYDCFLVRNPVDTFTNLKCSKAHHIRKVVSLILDIDGCLPEQALPLLASTSLPERKLTLVMRGTTTS